MFEVFFGGARGGGKTDGMLGEWASHADLYGGDAIGLMVRRTRTELSETIERSKILFTPLRAKWEAQEKQWRFPNGARLKFAYLENDSDADGYMGHSYTRVYVEEIGNFPREAPVLKLMATLRSAKGVPTGFRATGNPGGIGHAWVKARYVNMGPNGWVVKKFPFKNPFNGETIYRDRVYIPSRLSDNKILMDNDPNYVAGLQMQASPELVKAWLEGNWDITAGAAYEKLDRSKHIIRPFEIPKHWTKFTSLDWGTAKPYAHGWFTVPDEDLILKAKDGYPERLIYKGSIIQYREYYGWNGKPDEGIRHESWQVAQIIAAIETGIDTDLFLERIRNGENCANDIASIQRGMRRDRKGGDLEHIDYRIGDSAMWAEHDGPSIAENMQRSFAECGLECAGMEQSRKDRIANYQEMRNRISVTDGDEKPGFYTFPNCEHFWRTVPDLQLDQLHPEKGPDTKQEDHINDMVVYGLVSRPKAYTFRERDDTAYDEAQEKARRADRGGSANTGRY